jgi:ligand-binding sensor domain-containing protein
MQRKLFSLACFFIPIAIGSVNCLAQQYPFVYYTPKDGLINSRVKAIKQDSQGRMLFITYGGLSIYDGTRFINYNQQEGLANDLVNDIVELGTDSFLISTNTRRLNTLVHGIVGTYETVDHFYPVVNRFLKSRDGNLYVIADEGLFVLKNKKLYRLPLVLKGKEMGRNLDHIIEWDHYFLIIPWANELNLGLILYDRLSGKVMDTISRNKAFSIAVDPKNRIWLIDSKGLKWLDETSLKQGRLNVLSIADEWRSIIHPENTSFYFDPRGNSWFYSSGQIQKISTTLKSEIITAAEGFKGSSVSDIFQDREGIIWIASEGSGVIKLRTTNIHLLTSFVPGMSMSFSSIAQKGDTVWIFNGTDNAVYRVTESRTKKFPVGVRMRASNMYINGNKIFLCDGKQVACINNKNNPVSYTHSNFTLKDTSYVLGNGIIDPFGSIIQFVRKIDSGFYLIVVKNSRIIFRYKVSEMVDQMCFDQQGHLWLTTRDNHIMVFTVHSSDLSNYLQLFRDFPGNLTRLDPRSITFDKKNTLWIGTRFNGLYHFKWTGSRLQQIDQYTTRKGLTDNFIYSLACDEKNNLWVGTQSGLDKIFQKNNRYIVANIGKSNNIFQAISRIRTTKNGTVWAMNGDGSLIKIVPDTPVTAAIAPTLLLTAVKINNQLVPPGSKEFSFEQNNFLFTLAAPSFFDERSVDYSYWLEGSGNSQWSTPSNVSTFNFVNLAPGNYTLYVKAEFPEAMYPAQTINYSFTILPAWWQTWWFRAGLVLSLIGILISAIRFYYQRKLANQRMILERKQAIEKERTRIATDMHDDLGAGLSRIKFLSETIGIKKQQQQPIEDEVIKIREYSHQMIDKMGEIVWALNERNDSLNDLIAYTRAYAVEYLSQNGVECVMELPQQFDNYRVSGEFRRNIFLSVKEILHNIVKHAQANHVIIMIEIKKELTISIKDDGVGLAKKGSRSFSNGLYNIEKRMKDINGKSEIISFNGTTVCLIAPFV